MPLSVARRRRILSLALPIIGGMVSQNVLNLVDTAMVGTLGDAALAGVGLGSFANFMCIAFIIGMSTGVQAMSARRLGEGRDDEVAVPLNGGLLLVALMAVPATIALIYLAPYAFPLLEDDPEVVRLGTSYLQFRLIAMIGVGMNYAFRGYWNAIDRSRLYLQTLLIMHVSNIVLNYLLIFGHLGFPELGVTGAALGTTISTFIGLAWYMSLGLRFARGAGFMRALPRGETLSTMIRLAVPAGLQQFFFATGMVVFLRLVGMVGTKELAATTVLINLLLVVILPGMGFGLAAATLVGQALGRGDPQDAKQWGWDVCKLASMVLLVLALPAIITPRLILAPFIHDPATLALGEQPLRVIGSLLPFEAVALVMMNALFGAGAARTVMIASITMQWAIQLPLVWLVGPTLGWGLFAVWLANEGGRVLLSGVLAGVWHRGRWAQIKV